MQGPRRPIEALLLHVNPLHVKEVIEDALARRRLIVMVALCSIEYEGRGASRLGPGERLIIVKPDGSLLVHRSTGYSPVNWQPESDSITIQVRDEGLVLRSVRRRPREILSVTIMYIYLLLIIEALRDEAEFIEYLDESEIRDYLYEHLEEVEIGLKPLAKEKRVGEGYVDIFAVDSNGRHVIIEVKRTTAGPEAVRQLYRYVKSLQEGMRVGSVRGILVAPSISKEARLLLSALRLEYRRINIQQIYRRLREARRKRLDKGLLDFMASITE